MRTPVVWFVLSLTLLFRLCSYAYDSYILSKIHIMYDNLFSPALAAGLKEHEDVTEH